MSCPDYFILAPNRVWRTYLGGRTLEEISGNPAPADSHFPEDWLLSTTRANNAGRENMPDEGISSVLLGRETVSLTALLEQYPGEILGEEHWKRFGKNAGFLLKYLDSSIRLHLQCHPSIPFARAHLNSNCGKAEGYHILGVRPECERYIYLGFQHAVDQEAFRKAILEQDIATIQAGFEKIPVTAGDSFYVPGGIPHAIGAGVFMIELMEPTDFAVRIEFERGGYTLPESARFMGRDVDFALSMFDFTPRSVEETKREFFIDPQPFLLKGKGERHSLFDRRKTDCFRAEKIMVDGEMELRHDTFRVLIATKGTGMLHINDMTLPLNPFDRLLIPHKTPELRLSGKLEIFLAMPPPSIRDSSPVLSRAGSNR